MGNINISSSDITIYPAGRRQGNGEQNGTLLTEARLSSVVNSLLDIDGFVITMPGKNLMEENSLEFNLLGRYVQIRGGASNIASVLNISEFSPEDPQNNSSKYSAFIGFNIYTPDSDETTIFDEINGQDSDGYYNAIFTYISSSENVAENNTVVIDGNTCIKIGVGSYNSSTESLNWIIPESEFSKINYIDGGTID